MEELENKEIRADKWGEMAIGELVSQRDIILDKLMLLRSMPPSVTSENIVAALNMALNDVDHLLNIKTNTSTESTNTSNQIIGL